MASHAVVVDEEEEPRSKIGKYVLRGCSGNFLLAVACCAVWRLVLCSIARRNVVIHFTLARRIAGPKEGRC